RLAGQRLAILLAEEDRAPHPFVPADAAQEGLFHRHVRVVTAEDFAGHRPADPGHPFHCSPLFSSLMAGVKKFLGAAVRMPRHPLSLLPIETRSCPDGQSFRDPNRCDESTSVWTGLSGGIKTAGRRLPRTPGWTYEVR